MRDAVDATGLEGGYRQGLLNAAGGVETAVDFLPVVGDVLGLEDASRAYGQGDMVGAGINMMGVVPIIGDAGVKLSKGARSALRDQGFTEGFFHASKQDIQDGFKAGYGDGMVFVSPDKEFASNWVGKGKYQDRIGEEDLFDMKQADKQAVWDNLTAQYGDFDNWPEEIVDEYFAKQSAIVRQYDASGGAIYPVAVKANNQFDPESNPEIISEFLARRGQDPLGSTLERGKTDLEVYQEGNYLLFENKEMADFLKEKGYDSLWLREDTTKTGLAKPFSTLAVLDETGVKPVYDFAREADTAAKGAKSALRDIGENAPTNPQTSIEQLSQDIESRYGLDSFTVYEKGDDVTLGMITVPKGKRKQGVGTAAMNDLIEYADTNNKRVKLTPDVKGNDQGTTSRKRLVDFYKRFGFVENKGRNKDFTVSEGMFRLPQALNTATELPLDSSSRMARSALRVRPPSDNITNVRNANFQYPKTIGDETVNINSITGNLRVDQQEQNRINRLADQISSPEGYISRIIVDQNNNVIEGQHRLEALRQLGAKEVPVYKIEELADTMPVRKMEEAINTVGNIHSDHVNQIMQYALDNIAEEGVQGARNFDFGNFQKYYDAALNAVEDGESAFVGDVAAKGVKSALRGLNMNPDQ